MAFEYWLMAGACFVLAVIALFSWLRAKRGGGGGSFPDLGLR